MRSPLKKHCYVFAKGNKFDFSTRQECHREEYHLLPIIYLAFRFLRMPISSLFSIAGIKHHKQNQLGKERVCLSLQL